jgi:hypothetical protein
LVSIHLDFHASSSMMFALRLWIFQCNWCLEISKYKFLFAFAHFYSWETQEDAKETALRVTKQYRNTHAHMYSFWTSGSNLSLPCVFWTTPTVIWCYNFYPISDDHPLPLHNNLQVAIVLMLTYVKNFISFSK